MSISAKDLRSKLDVVKDIKLGEDAYKIRVVDPTLILEVDFNSLQKAGDDMTGVQKKLLLQVKAILISGMVEPRLVDKPPILCSEDEVPVGVLIGTNLKLSMELYTAIVSLTQDTFIKGWQDKEK